jgi:hypothetical protein
MAKGFDISIYPGDTAMANWWNNTPFSFCGFYLAPTASGQHTNTSWMSKRSYLQGLGYGLAVIYVGRQASQSNLTYAQGQSDAADANTLAKNAGFSKMSTTVFLDVEQGGTLSSAFLSYINGWIDYMKVDTIFRPGIYCSHSSTADQIRNANSYASSGGVDFWVWNLTQPPSPGNTTSTGTLTPADSGVSYAMNWQYAQNVSETWNGTTLTVDLDLASSANPSNA